MLASFVPSATDYLAIPAEIIMDRDRHVIMLLEPLLGGNKRTASAAHSAGIHRRAGGGRHGRTACPARHFQHVDRGWIRHFLRVLVIGVGILTVLSSAQYLKREHARRLNITHCCCFP